MRRHRRALRTVAVAGSIALIVSATTSSASAQVGLGGGGIRPRRSEAPVVLVDGRPLRRRIRRAVTRRSRIASYTPNSASSASVSPAAVSRVRDNGPDERVVTGLPSIASETEQLGPSDIAFTGSKTFVLSIGLGGSDEFRAAFGDDGALLATLVTGTARSSGGLVVRRRHGQRSGRQPRRHRHRQQPSRACCDTATATWSPTPAATPSCRRRAGARSRR